MHGDDRCLRAAPAQANDHVAGRSPDGQINAQGGRQGLRDQLCITNLQGRFVNGATLSTLVMPYGMADHDALA